MNKIKCLIILTGFVFSCRQPRQACLDLSGHWQFAVDSLDVGESEKWYQTPLTDSIRLPGSMASNGKGDEISMDTPWTGGIQNKTWFEDARFAPYHDPDNIRFPFWLQPVKKYTGPAWYQKEIMIPQGWEKKEICLKLERCHWETTVWVDGKKIGSQNSLSTPHRYSLNGQAGRNTITIRVDNRIKEIDVGFNAHSVTDHTQSNWNGIAGEIVCEAKEPVHIGHLLLTPDIDKQSIHVDVKIINHQKAMTAMLTAQAKPLFPESQTALQPVKRKVELDQGQNSIEFEYALGPGALLWDEFHPNLYQLDLTLAAEGQTMAMVHRETFGLRQIAVENHQICVNHRPVFLRGTLECAVFPQTGFPPADEQAWEHICQKIKAFGLNHIRFHSWCPPEAAFTAADKAGIYLQVECGSWANQSTTLGDGKAVDEFVWEESRRIVREYGNHPSFCLMAYGNEPGGEQYKAFLAEFISWWKLHDKRRIYTGAAGWPELPQNDYHNIDKPRIQLWGEELNSVINGEPPKTDFDWHSRSRMPGDSIPVISHEIGQWCAYPDLSEIQQYTGVLRARNFEMFQESLTANGLGHLANPFLMASGKLQALCYKADIEAALRSQGFGGFQLLDLHDFPGQGTATVGVLNAFWEEKGYITADAFSRFCNPSVPLARLKKRIFLEGDTLKARLEMAHFNAAPWADVRPRWELLSSAGELIAGDTLEVMNIPIGNGIHLGDIAYGFQQTGMPRKLCLEVTAAVSQNSWDLWVYPENRDIKNQLNIRITDVIDAPTLAALEKGESVLLSLGRGRVKSGKGGEVGVGFSSIFWNTAWTLNQKPHTLGILCDPSHPALGAFPTEFHSNWQWWDAMSHSDVINLNALHPALKPIVRVIDDWFSNRPLGLLMEMKTGGGRLLISGIDLHSNLEGRPEARQLLFSLNQYMNSDAFNPDVEVDINQIADVLKSVSL